MTVDVTSPWRFSIKQRMILLVLLGAGFILAVDFSILNVALPEIGAGVGFGLTGLPWVTSAYALPRPASPFCSVEWRISSAAAGCSWPVWSC